MATRSKTIEFATTVDTTNLAVATNRDKTITIYIPETVSAFKSCTLMCNFRGDNTAATSIGAAVLTIGTNGTFATSAASTGVSASGNSTESEAWCYGWDFVSFFSSNWSGTSNTWSVRINVPNLPTANHSFKLIITYEYDDTATTHIKTVRIPIESTRANLTASYQTIGGATAIPAVEGAYLPEDSVVVRQAFLELMANETGGTTTDFTVSIRINGGTATDIWRSEQALTGNATWAYATVDITAEDLSAARSLEAISTTTSRFEQLGGWLTVTYEFNADNTTTVYNSIVVGAIDTTGWAGGTTSADQDAWGRDIFIEEPGTITLKESGMVIGANTAGTFTLNVGAGGQTGRDYAFSLAKTITLGQFTLVHRIDASGQVGVAGITLARGRNSYLAKVYSTTANEGWNINGFLILNYTSGIASDGPGVHAQSRFFQIAGVSAAARTKSTSSKQAAQIPETNYWLIGACVDAWIGVAASPSESLAFQAERGSGEGEESGWETLGIAQFWSDNENTNFTGRFAGRRNWRRYPNDPDSQRMDIETSRSFRVDSTAPAFLWYGMWATWHAHTYAVSGTVSGSGGGTVNLYLHRHSDGELLDSTSRTGDGSYSFTWYDNTEEVYVRAYESDLLVGQTAPDVAV